MTQRVVIVGSGFGGLFAAKTLRRTPVEVTVVDRVNHHLFQPLMYQVATGILSEGEIAPPTRDILRRQQNVRVVQGEARRVDLEARRLHVRRIDGGEAELEFEYLIAATGMRTSYFGNDTFRERTLGMKTLADALALRAEIFSAFERAEWEQDPEQRRRRLTFAIVGGGPTGVELAGQIGELAHRSLKGNFRSFDPAREVRVVLLDTLPRILTPYSERQSAKAARALERLGVELEMNARVSSIDDHGLTFTREDGSEQRLDAMTRVWAAGVQADDFAAEVARATGAQPNRRGQIGVQDDCSVPGHPNVFCVGDIMALHDLPGLAEVAMQSGRHAAEMVRADLAGRERRPFRYRDLGSMAAVSRTSAVAQFHGLRFSGLFGWLAWLGVHLFFLTGFKNRLTTVVHWAVTFLGRARSERAFADARAALPDPANTPDA